MTRSAIIVPPLSVFTVQPFFAPFAADEEDVECFMDETGVHVKREKEEWGEERAEDMNAVQSRALYEHE